MNCKHVNNLLSQYAAGELSASVQAQVANHLKGDAHCNPCADCAARLHMLQSVLPLLQADAQKAAASPTPDMYAAFRQRLVTQPTRAGHFPSLSGRLRWLPRFALGVAGLTALAGGRYYRQHRYDAVLDQAINAMSQSFDNVHLTTDRGEVETDGRSIGQGGETWVQGGYSVSRMFNIDYKKGRQQLPSDYTRSMRYTLPSGITFSWQQYPSPTPSIRLFWSPALPEHPDSEVKYTVSEITNYLANLKDSGDMQAAGIHVTHEEVGGETFLRLTIDHLRKALPEYQNGGNNPFPLPLSVWLDGQNRLRKYQEQKQYNQGTRETTEYLYDYNQHIPRDTLNGSLDAPALPVNTRTVVREYRQVKGKQHSVDHAVNPVWLTMLAVDQQRIKDTITRWGQAWSARDSNRLRSLVDLDWPLEITRPDKRVGLTREDVWQQVWTARMANEPRWKTFTPQTVFAYQAAPFEVQETALSFHTHFEEGCLPGLNALCWIRGKQQDGKNYVFPARLFLVKRADGWKVFQYCRMTPSLFVQSVTNPERAE